MNLDSTAVPNVRASCQRILCTDDNHMVRESIRRVLETQGYEVRCAADGLEALQVIREAPEPFDLLVTDHDMPFLTGLELVRHLRAKQVTMKVIVISGTLTAEDIRNYDSLGVDRILQKPFLAATIVAAAASACARSERQKMPAGILEPLTAENFSRPI